MISATIQPEKDLAAEIGPNAEMVHFHSGDAARAGPEYSRNWPNDSEPSDGRYLYRRQHRQS